MEINSQLDLSRLETRILSVGIDLSIIESLVNIIDCSMRDELEVNKIDVANLTVITKRMVKIAKNKFDRIENILNI